MLLARKIRPANSLVFIADPDGGEPPMPIRGMQLLSTPTCISVACYPEQDGETEVRLGDMAEVDPGYEPIFDGALSTPNRAVMVSTASYEPLLKAEVPRTSTRVRIWVNHPRWPDKVMIGVN